jgi:large subunit ribosomal protein L21
MKNNDDFAVIRLQGGQYVVKDGDTIQVDKLKNPKKAVYDVLLARKSGKVNIGTPKIDSVKVDLKVVTDVVKGKKVRIFKYKSKSRYRKRMGFRPQTSELHISSVK